ncbi:MAG: M1 family peptidase [Bacteroidetes bacterium]|nr:MAG: M1 family peptidase [Bacteroidota bacterium]
MHPFLQAAPEWTQTQLPNMKKIWILLVLTCPFGLLVAQPDYFQQEVHYTIQCTLDDQTHTLTGTVDMEYINHSPDALDLIYMHLWGNAFQDQESAFARQKRREGSTLFYFAKKEDLGYYADLDFKVNEASINWRLDKQHKDIAILSLPEPLPPGGKIRISTPFTLKIPASWSRLGHVGTSYQMTQWYPKPAVYDREGWHPMPYLDMGEFYSEFGSFDVQITLPENYVVGATGTLETPEEKAFLDQKIAETKAFFDNLKRFKADVQLKEYLARLDTFPPSSNRMKTLRYKADHVHDFAWFADKRFLVEKSEVALPSGRKVDTWTMFPYSQANLWEKSVEFVNRSVAFYSEKVGEYPWPQATAVHSALSAGGGMEYPMLTVIGNNKSTKDLDDVITHEVGHNWFYGILGTNERDHPWMDEGINSYYEYRYMDHYYGDKMPVDVPAFLLSDLHPYEAFYQLQARRRLDQAPDTPSDDFNTLNYGLGAYVKPGLAFGHLEHYLGTTTFDQIMQDFYREWQFKHPRPEDLRAHLERESGKDLSWFFDGYLFSTDHLDYAIRKIDPDAKTVVLVNKGDIAAPVPLGAIAGEGGTPVVQWIDGFLGEKSVSLPDGDFEKIELDPNHVTLDVNRKNNAIKTRGLFKKAKPFRPDFLANIEHISRRNLFWAPLPLWNVYDGWMPALALHNQSVPLPALEFFAMPVWSFKSKSLNGLGTLQWTTYPKNGPFQSLSLGASFKSFHYDRRDSLRAETGFSKTNLRYMRAMPSLTVRFRKPAASNFFQTARFRSMWINEEHTVFEVLDPAEGAVYTGNDFSDRWVHELQWTGEMRRVLNPFSLSVTLEQGRFTDGLNRRQKYVKAAFEYQTAFTYAPKRSFDVRFFVGAFLQNSLRNGFSHIFNSFNLTAQGFNDYKYDDVYFGRNERDGLWSRQIYIKEGGMKAAFGGAQSLGRSNDFIVALNLKTDLPQDLPFHLPLKPYFDIGYFNDKRAINSDATFNQKLWWSGGLSLEFFDGIVGIYFPILNSKNGVLEISGEPDPNGLRSLYKAQGNYWQRISFSIDFQRLNPKKILDKTTL